MIGLEQFPVCRSRGRERFLSIVEPVDVTRYPRRLDELVEGRATGKVRLAGSDSGVR